MAEEIIDLLANISGLTVIGRTSSFQFKDKSDDLRKEKPKDWQAVGSAMAHFAAGRKAESDAQLAEAIRQNATIWPQGIASVYAFRGEKDRAFEWLDRAYEARDHLYYIKGDPLFKNLGNDPRYKAFLRKMNLPEEPRREVFSSK